jgi:hypothetical protein
MADAQKWAAASVASWLASFSSLMADMLAFPGPPALVGQVTVSYYSGGSWVQHQPSGAYKFHPTLRATPLVDDVVNVTLSPRIGSQRRRLQGG